MQGSVRAKAQCRKGGQDPTGPASFCDGARETEEPWVSPAWESAPGSAAGRPGAGGQQGAGSQPRLPCEAELLALLAGWS